MVWYSHLFQNFPQFIVIHTVKGFGTVNKAEIDVFLELSCFFYDPADVGNFFFRLFSTMLHVCSVMSNSLQSFWTVAHQVPLSMGFFRQGYWSGLPFPPLRALPDPRIEPMSPVSPTLQADSLPAEPSGKLFHYRLLNYID